MFASQTADHLELKFGLILLDDLKDPSKSPRNDSRVFLLSIPQHSKSFSWASLSICKDAYIEAIDCWLN